MLRLLGAQAIRQTVKPLASSTLWTEFAKKRWSSTACDVARVRRSVLYMPASNERALEKAKTIDCDGLILDIEDAVAPEKKPMARDNAVRAAQENHAKNIFHGKEVVIRVNGLTTPWFEDDVKAACASNAHAILLPKTERASDVHMLEERMIKHNAAQTMGIWCMIETPLGVLNALEIAGASDRLQCLVMGTVDLANELHCNPSAVGRWNMMFSLQQSILAARTSKKSVLDGVYINLQDEMGFKQECEQGRNLGFDGKTLIHPKTIQVANEVFSPTTFEIDHAKKVVEAHQQAEAAGHGVATVNGKLVEALHVRDAKRILAFAEQINNKK